MRIKTKLLDVFFNLCLILSVISYLVPTKSTSNSQLAIAPLLGLGISVGASALKGLFGKRKNQLSAEQRIARQQYLDYINNQGYAAGEKSALQGQLQRNIGTDLGLQGAIQNERLARFGDTAFSDSQRSQLAQAYANAVSQGMSNIDIAGQNRAFAATQALANLQPTEQSKGNFFDVLGDVGGALAPVFAYKYGNQDSKAVVPQRANSSIDYKTDIQPTDPKKMLEAVKNLDVKAYRYKPGIEDGGEQQRVGIMAEESPPMLQTPDGKGIDMQNLIMTLLGAVQGLSNDLDLVRKFAGSVKEIRKIEKYQNA